MADAMTTTGRRELLAATNRFPGEVQAALQAVAEATAGRIQQRAQALCPRATGKTADAIAIRADLANRQILVESKSPSGRPGNLVLWLEWGTIKRPAVLYMRRAAEGEMAQYRGDMAAAAEATARRVFTD